ncbi:hypothetical protein VHEMI04699 [[Torrubiella] hemipterigena]|uniref:Uncharacterized protein n=1 Tax=[Torrubiella] hemipterigena TaxID=1531966 RepID=A0A0A1T1Z2_9HYPO|nr:hypothetical protein VHEMI04699 [[Torrubiella] hemipterigena]
MSCQRWDENSTTTGKPHAAEPTTAAPKPTNADPKPSQPVGPITNGTAPGVNNTFPSCPKPPTKTTTICPEDQKPTTVPGVVPGNPSKPDTSAPAIVPIGGAASTCMSGVALLVAGVAALLQVASLQAWAVQLEGWSKEEWISCTEK